MSEVKVKPEFRSELEKNGIIAFVPKGNSMWPTLKNRKQSVIVAKKTQRLKPFDVALYERDNGICVLHRVIEVHDSYYVICGDSQFYYEKVDEDAVIGVMTSFYRGNKSVEVTDPKYIKEINKWYSNDKRRKRKVNRFYFRQRLKYKTRYIVNRLIGKKNV